MTTFYLTYNTSASVELQKSIRRKNCHSFGLSDSYIKTARFLEEIRSRFTKTEPFIEGKTIFDESRWLALYCTTNYYTKNIVLMKARLRGCDFEAFCAHYGIDGESRNFLGGAEQ